MSNIKVDRKYQKWWGGLALLILSVMLAGCGYSPPPNGGGLTPYVVVVTPTAISAVAAATAQPPASPISTPASNPVNTAPAPAGTPTVKVVPTLAVNADNTYTVRVGDTLLGIAIRLDVDLDALVEINNIPDPNNLKIGQVLKLPPRPTVTTAANPTKKS
jgi:lipoprotein NlpD